MSLPINGDKAVQTGLVDMGNISFYNNTSAPLFQISDLSQYPGSFSEMVLNVTWAQLQAAEGGALTTSAIDSAIAQVNAYNAANGADLGLKLRVWGGYTAPEWAKNINGAPITVPGPASVDPSVNTPQTIGRFWTADYINAWTSLQNTLAALYDGNPVIRGISQTAGANATDEPFVPLKTLGQVAQLQAGGYSDAAEMLTLRAAIADYSQWSTTPLDYTMNTFHLYDSGNELPGGNFTLAVLQQARNSSRLVQAGNHALGNPFYFGDVMVYGQIQADAALKPAVPPGSFQTNAPIILGPYSNWQSTIVNGVALNAGNIELWDFPTARGVPNGFLSLTAAEVQDLAAILAAGSPPPTAGAPTDGAALGFIAPASVTGAAGSIAFTGTNAVLVASVDPQASFTVTLQSMAGGTLGIEGFSGAVVGSASGPQLTLSGSAAAVNTVLAHLTDTLQSGTDVVHVTAFDNSGNVAFRDVGVQIAPPAAGAAIALPGLLAADQSFAFGGGSVRVVGQGSDGNLDIAGRLGTSGILVVGGVQSALSVADLDITGSTSLVAALSPGAYSTASLAVGGALEVHGGATARFSGSLAASTVTVDPGGLVHANGALAATSGGSIRNDGTIEAAADQTLGLQRLNIANGVSGSGALLIDAGATLRLGGTISPTQTIAFADPMIAQLANGPYSPSTLVLAQPSQAQNVAISGFSFADRLVLEGVTATSASYAGSTLTVNLAAGGPLIFSNVTGSLTGLSPTVSAGNTIAFTGSVLPSVVPPARLQGSDEAAVYVPNVVLETPLPANPPSTLDMTVSVSLTASGRLSAGNDHGNTIVTGNNSGALTLEGTLDAVERSLQTLTYKMAGTGSQDITIFVTDYAGTSAAPATVTVTSGGPLQFEWTAAGGGSFSDFANWNATAAPPGTTPPGGTNIALLPSLPSGAYTVSGDGAVGVLSVTGTTTLTGQVLAQGRNGTAVVVDSGGALTLAGGAVLSAQQQATVGAAGQGLLVAMGGALALTGPATANALVIAEQAGSTGTVLNLEQITAAGTVVVGAAGNGTLELLGVAASVSDGAATIGQLAGSHGSVIVNGGEWMTDGPLIVGDAGTGSLLVNGLYRGTTGQVTAFNATIGGQAGGQGSVMLDGGEMLVANGYAASSTLAVGAGSPGSLVLANGSEVAVGSAYGTIAGNNGALVVGGSAGAPGLIRVGSYSSLLVYGDTTIGSTAAGGVVTVGQGGDHSALLALTGTLKVNGTGQVILGGVDAQLHASAIDVAPGGVVAGSGTLAGDFGGNHTVALAHVDNEGSITAVGGNLLIYGAVTGSGTLAVAEDATLTLQGDVEASQTLAFGPHAQAVLNDPRAFHATISGFVAGDRLDLASTEASNPSYSNGVLTLDTPFGPLQLKFNGHYAANGFSVQPDGLGGTYVSGGQGDVHMVSFDGFHYDFQAVGQFVAARSTGPGTPWQVQIQTDGTHGIASYTTGLATSSGNAAVIFAVGQPITLHVDGMPDTVLRGDAAQSLPGGTFTPLAADTWQVAWNAGETIVVSEHGIALDWQVSPGPHDDLASVQGLLGTHSAPWSYVSQADGPPQRQAYSNDRIVGAYADAWRVAHDASLLDHHAVWDSHAVL